MKKTYTIILAIVIILNSCSTSNNEQQDKKIKKVKKVHSSHPLDVLHERINLHDYDLTLEEFISKKPNKVSNGNNVIYLVPFGNMKPEVLEIIKDEIPYLNAFFQMSIQIMDPISFDQIKQVEEVKTRMVPDNDYAYYSKEKGESINLREQIEANSFMDAFLKNMKTRKTYAILGITEHDIYNPKFNYLFGVSKLEGGIGLVSTYRLIDYKERTKYNLRRVISKQIVNMFGIKNVKDYNCLLNFHNNKEELEQGEFKLSPVALDKLQYCIGFDPIKRFEDLREIWYTEQVSEMEAYYTKSIQIIKKTRNEKTH